MGNEPENTHFFLFKALHTCMVCKFNNSVLPFVKRVHGIPLEILQKKKIKYKILFRTGIALQINTEFLS